MTVNIDVNAQFLEDGETIKLISIALVADSGYSLYCINQDMPLGPVSQHTWLREHVVPSLPLLPLRMEGDNPWDVRHEDFYRIMPKEEIAERVRKFITQYADPVLWADCGAYTHVVMAQLWGRMDQLPPGVPMYTSDLQTEIRRLGHPVLPSQLFGQYNALATARHQRRVRGYLQELETRRGSGS